MRRIIIFIFISTLTSIAYGQSYYSDMYAVNDSDGYVNIRSGPGIRHDIVLRKTDKMVLKRTTEKKIVDGWIPVSDMYSVHLGYIYQNRLQQLSKLAATKLFKYSGEIYMLSHDIPNLFVTQSGDCNLVVRDILNDNIILLSKSLVCLNIVPGDTLSFCYQYGSKLNNTGHLVEDKDIPSVFVTYKIYLKENDVYDYYTQLSPEPQTVPAKEAQKMVNAIIQKISKDLKGDKSLFYTLPEFKKYCSQLFTAYCSGVDAWDIINNSGCDASRCGDIDLFQSLLNDYNRSEIRPVTQKTATPKPENTANSNTGRKTNATTMTIDFEERSGGLAALVEFKRYYIFGKDSLILSRATQQPFTGNIKGYYPNGQLATNLNFEQGMWLGWQSEYYQTGRLRSKYLIDKDTYKNRPQSIPIEEMFSSSNFYALLPEVYIYTEDELLALSHIKEGKSYKLTAYFEGKKLQEGYLRRMPNLPSKGVFGDIWGVGRWIMYNTNGTKRLEGDYGIAAEPAGSNGPTGEWIIYSENGSEASRFQYGGNKIEK